MAFGISDQTAGNSDRKGLRFLASTSPIGAGIITLYFPSEGSAILAYTNFNSSGRCAYPGDNTNTDFGVIFWNPHSFNTSIISLMDSRTSLVAGHTAASVVSGSLSLLRRLCCASGHWCRQNRSLSDSFRFVVEPQLPLIWIACNPG